VVATPGPRSGSTLSHTLFARSLMVAPFGTPGIRLPSSHDSSVSVGSQVSRAFCKTLMVAQIWYGRRSYSRRDTNIGTDVATDNSHSRKKKKTLMAAQIWRSMHSCRADPQTSGSTSGPTSHTLSQNVDGLCKFALEAFLPRRRTTSASPSRPTSHTLLQNVDGRANLPLDAFSSRRHTTGNLRALTKR
jgi:hypothetical protein